VAGRWFSPVFPVSSTYKTDRHDITEILLKVALSTIKLTIQHNFEDIAYVVLLYAIQISDIIVLI
jgi:hypothetical protein